MQLHRFPVVTYGNTEPKGLIKEQMMEQRGYYKGTNVGTKGLKVHLFPQPN